jgi:hypothetical protein
MHVNLGPCNVHGKDSLMCVADVLSLICSVMNPRGPKECLWWVDLRWDLRVMCVLLGGSPTELFAISVSGFYHDIIDPIVCQLQLWSLELSSEISSAWSYLIFVLILAWFTLQRHWTSGPRPIVHEAGFIVLLLSDPLPAMWTYPWPMISSQKIPMLMFSMGVSGSEAFGIAVVPCVAYVHCSQICCESLKMVLDLKISIYRASLTMSDEDCRSWWGLIDCSPSTPEDPSPS